jgi:hypothetical protein
LLAASRNMPVADQAAAVMQVHGEYQAGHRRRDDLSLFCVQVL